MKQSIPVTVKSDGDFNGFSFAAVGLSVIGDEKS